MKRPEVGTTELANALASLDPGALKATIMEIIQASAPLPFSELAGRYDGDVVLTPADQNLKPKELPLEQYIGKMVAIRDNLRVLEQKINSHKGLNSDEKLDLQVRITRAHSSLLSAAGRWAPPEGSQTDETARRLLLRLAREGEWKALALPGPGLGDRWRGGSAYYGTDEDGVEEPLEVFFHRLCVVRDRLFALEAVIQTHPKLSGEEGDSMSQYLRRSYGTLTTFNLLFRDRDDYFSSSR